MTNRMEAISLCIFPSRGLTGSPVPSEIPSQSRSYVYGSHREEYRSIRQIVQANRKHRITHPMSHHEVRVLMDIELGEPISDEMQVKHHAP